jgi:Leucine-rich repeat (LRR) protein
METASVQPQIITTDTPSRPTSPWKSLLALSLILISLSYLVVINLLSYQRSFHRHQTADVVETVPPTIPLTDKPNTNQAIILGNTNFSQNYLAQQQLLTLQQQNYKMIPNEVYQAQLVGLYLDFNPLGQLSLALTNPSLLQALTLAETRLDVLSAEVGSLTNLVTLHLHFNNLQTLPPEIGNLSNLEELKLDHNQILELPLQAGGWQNIKRLDLSGNDLTDLPTTIAGWQRTEQLNLSGNQLAFLPAEIGLLSSLTELQLKDNQLSSLPATMDQLTNLKVLDLSGNQLNSLPPSLLALTGLERLYLGGNQLNYTQISQLKVRLPNTIIFTDLK